MHVTAWSSLQIVSIDAHAPSTKTMIIMPSAPQWPHSQPLVHGAISMQNLAAFANHRQWPSVCTQLAGPTTLTGYDQQGPLPSGPSSAQPAPSHPRHACMHDQPTYSNQEPHHTINMPIQRESLVPTVDYKLFLLWIGCIFRLALGCRTPCIPNQHVW